MTTRILNGDCRAMLRTLPEASVHMVVTSPPYWGLRDYNGLPQIWGAADCAHEWGEDIPSRQQTGGTGSSTLGPASGGHGISAEGIERSQRRQAHQAPPTAFCTKCAAWRGQLGLEPTPQLFTDHMVEIFREIWRVLHPSGTAWLNLGDCYATGAGSVGDAPGGGEQGARWRGEIERHRDDKRPDHGGRTRALRDGTHAGKNTGMAGIGPMTQPNRMPIPGLKPKDLVGVPWRAAFALQADGWWIRNDIIWAKKNCMPESVTDRCTKSHEYIFLLTKSESYYYDSVAIEEPQEEHERTRRLKEQENGLDTVYNLRRDQPHGQVAPGTSGVAKSAKARQDLALKGTRNKRSVWHVGTAPFPEAHFATFPPELIEPCILAGTSERGHCPTCGEGWERITRRAPAEGAGSGNIERKPASARGVPVDTGGSTNGAVAGSVPWDPTVAVTIGWYPGCSCKAKPLPLPRYPAKPKDKAPAEEVEAWRQAVEVVDAERAKICAGMETWPTVRGVVLDTFGGAGTTGLVADRHHRDAVLIELNPEYIGMAERRIVGDAPLFAEVSTS